jgi:hypothetical protein
MVNISRKNGFALALAIYFMILAAITSIGVYAYSSYIVREAKIDKGASVRGYYAVVAGARLAYILLKDPQTFLVTNKSYVTTKPGYSTLTTPQHDGQKVFLTINPSSTYNGLGYELELRSGEKLEVTVEEYNSADHAIMDEYNTDNPSSPQWTPDHYRVIATFTKK